MLSQWQSTDTKKARRNEHTLKHKCNKTQSVSHKHTPCGRGGLASASSYHISLFLILSPFKLFLNKPFILACPDFLRIFTSYLLYLQ